MLLGFGCCGSFYASRAGALVRAAGRGAAMRARALVHWFRLARLQIPLFGAMEALRLREADKHTHVPFARVRCSAPGQRPGSVPVDEEDVTDAVLVLAVDEELVVVEARLRVYKGDAMEWPRCGRSRSDVTTHVYRQR